MPAEKSENQNNDQFEFLFGKPSLLEGEDEERYLQLRAAIVAELEPKSVFDWINAKDQVDKLWEEERYKRAATALTRASNSPGLTHAPHVPTGHSHEPISRSGAHKPLRNSLSPGCFRIGPVARALEPGFDPG